MRLLKYGFALLLSICMCVIGVLQGTHASLSVAVYVCVCAFVLISALLVLRVSRQWSHILIPGACPTNKQKL